MRNNEERVAAVRRRVAQIERRKHQRQRRLLTLAATAASLALIVGLSFVLANLSADWSPADAAACRTTASIFTVSSAAGYLLIGLLAFVLGVCVTLFCLKLRAFTKSSEEGEAHDD